GKPGEPLGALCLAVRALQIAGFVLGGLLAPLVLRLASYCDACGRYRKNRIVAVVPAGIPDKLIGNNSPERTAERNQRREAAEAMLQAVLRDVAGGDGAAAAAKLLQEGPLAKKA